MKSIKSGRIILGTKKKSDVDASMPISNIIMIIVYISIMFVLIAGIYSNGSEFYEFLDSNLK